MKNILNKSSLDLIGLTTVVPVIQAKFPMVHPPLSHKILHWTWVGDLWLTMGVSLGWLGVVERTCIGVLALVSGAVAWLFLPPGLRLFICEVRIDLELSKVPCGDSPRFLEMSQEKAMVTSCWQQKC